MAEYTRIQYFLGANSPSGFYSLYDQLISTETAVRIYILKGGPGCGKSTLMRKVSQLLEQEGVPAEHILCSGDPDSLDGVVFHGLNAALVDGTSPHVVEPGCPGAVDSYVNLGDCYDREGLGDVRREIMACMKGYKGCYQSAYRCLNAASQIRADMRAILLTQSLSHRLARRAEGILSREIKPRRGEQPGQVKQRFLGAVTHRGPVCLFQTAFAQCQRIYELSDPYGLAHDMLTHLLSGAVRGGYDVVACPDPMAPDRLAHLIIPQLSLAFLSTGQGVSLPGKSYRRVRLDAMADQELMRRNRPRLRFARKVSAALVEEAVESLARAKKMHDQLEALYNPYVDFEQVDRTARRIAEELLALKPE